VGQPKSGPVPQKRDEFGACPYGGLAQLPGWERIAPDDFGVCPQKKGPRSCRGLSGSREMISGSVPKKKGLAPVPGSERLTCDKFGACPSKKGGLAPVPRVGTAASDEFGSVP
jgi:hypothetical protein